MKTFATRVTTQTIKKDSSITKLNPVNEAIKNAIDAEAKNINIYVKANTSNNKLFINDITLIVEDNGNGFDCLDVEYMNDRWTHYKGGKYIPNSLGGRSRGRYSYLKFVDYKEENLKDIKVYTKFHDKCHCVTFCVEDRNINFKITEEKSEYIDKTTTTQLCITKLGEEYIKKNYENKGIEHLISNLEKNIVVEFADRILKNISITINGKLIDVESYIEAKKEKTYKLLSGKKFEVYMVVWKNEIDLIDKKHTFLFNEEGNYLGKIPSGSKKSIFNCHSVFLTSSIFKDDYELLELDTEYKILLEEMKELYKCDLDKLLFSVWIKNKDIIANDLAQRNRLLNSDIDIIIKEKISEAYRILAVPLMLNQHNISKNNRDYFSNSLLGLISDNNSYTLSNLEFVFKLKEEHQEIMNYVNQNLDILKLVKKYYDITLKLDFLHHFENLVFNEGKQDTKERTELHKIVNNHLWIFGEEYSNLEFFSDQSLKGIFREIGLPTEFDDEELNKIPDIFIPKTKDNKLILIELKRPKVKITHTILNEVLSKYVLKILKTLERQDSPIKSVQAICISSQKEEYIAALKEDRYEIQAMSWKEIIEKRRKENNELLQDITKKLSLSHYEDIKDFKEKEVAKDKNLNGVSKV